MNLSDLLEQAKGIQNRMESLLQEAQQARQDQAHAQLKFEKVRDEFSRWMAAEQFRMKNSPDVGLARDPQLDQITPEYAETVMQEMLEHNPEYHERKDKYWSSKEELEDANMRHVNATEELSVLKSRANLISAILKYGSDHTS